MRFVMLLVVAAATPLVPSLAWSAPAKAALTVDQLRTEYKVNPLGLGAVSPASAGSCARVPAVPARRPMRSGSPRPQAHSRPAAISSGAPGRVASDESIHRMYEGRELRSGQRCSWQVRVWDGGRRVPLERAGVFRDGPSRALRLEDELDRARRRGRRDEDGADTDAAPRLQAPGDQYGGRAPM